ncbi:hypothetical protein P9112_002734 [Eukaryota sp. TZLM1-RC]
MVSSFFGDGTMRPPPSTQHECFSPRYQRSAYLDLSPRSISTTSGVPLLHSPTSKHSRNTSSPLPHISSLDVSLPEQRSPSPRSSLPSSPRSFLPSVPRNLERYGSPSSSPLSPSSKVKVLITVPLPRQVLHHLRSSCPDAQISAINHQTDTKTIETELKRLALGTNIIVGLPSTTPYTVITSALPTLKLFQSVFAGVEDLVQFMAPFPDVVLCNNHGNSNAVAQHAISMLFSLAHRLVDNHNAVAKGMWNDLTSAIDGETPSEIVSFETRSVWSMNIGVLGFGHIGRRVVEMLTDMKVNVCVCKRSDVVRTDYRGKVYSINQFDEFLSSIDALIITLPLTNETRHLIGKRHLKLLKSCFIVNISRGAIIQELPLFQALTSNQIAGFATDVFWKESDPSELSPDKYYPYTQPFHTLPNVLLSPHRADSPAWNVEYFNSVVDNINSFSEEGKSLINIVDRSLEY